MFRNNINFLKSLNEKIDVVIYTPFEEKFLLYKYSYSKTLEDNIIFWANNYNLLVPFIYDMEKTDKMLLFLVENHQKIALKEFIERKDKVDQYYFLKKLLKQLHRFLILCEKNDMGFKVNLYKNLYIAQNEEFYIEDLWEFSEQNFRSNVNLNSWLDFFTSLKKDFPFFFKKVRIGKIGAAEEIFDLIEKFAASLEAEFSVDFKFTQTISLNKYFCKNHPDVEAEFRCRICKNFFCRKCIIFLKKIPVCEECLKNKYDKVLELSQKMDSETASQFNIYNPTFFKYLLGALLFDKNSIKRLMESLSFWEIGLCIIANLLGLFFAYAQMDFCVFKNLIIWKSLTFIPFFLILTLVFHYENPLIALFVILFPLLFTDIFCIPISIFYPCLALYLSYFWASLVSINYFLYGLKVSFYELFISWFFNLIILIPADGFLKVFS